MFGFEGKKKEAPKVDGMEAENVVPMTPPAAEQPGIVVRDSMGNVVGSAASPAEAHAKQVQANIDAREAA